MAATYQIKITNQTDRPYKCIIKSPNIPSPVPLDAAMMFPPMYTCTLDPLASSTFTSKVPSDSQQAHLFLIKATPVSKEKYLLALENDVLTDLWKDEGGLKGDYCFINMTTGAKDGGEGCVSWQIGFSWRAWTLAPKIEVRGTGPGGAMRYEDK